MHRLFAAVALALLAVPAAAQSPLPAGPSNQSSLALIAPTAPTDDNSNRIATTAWLNNFINAGLPLASGKIWIGSVGNIATPQTPSGDLTVSNGGVFTLATVNSNVGSFGSATQCATVTVNAKGLITAASATTCTPAVGSITGLAANMATWLATSSSANLRAALTDETGTGLAYFQGGDIGTPSAGVGSNLTALNATQLTSGTIPAARTNGHQNGTATNDNGAAGEVGEYIESDILIGSAVSLTTGSPTNLTSISLTAGDWDTNCSVVFTPSGIPTALFAAINTTSATLPTAPGKGAYFALSVTYPSATAQIISTGTQRLSLSGTTTTFCVLQAAFPGTMTAYGIIRARRAR